MIELQNETQEIKVFSALEAKIVERKGRKKIPKCWHCQKPLEIGVNNITCPNCGSEFAEKPRTEARYHILQKEYLATRNSNTLGKILLIVEEVSYNIICGRLKSNGRFLDDELINDKTSWVVEKMFKYYHNKPDFFISFSAIDYISQVCLYALYGHAFKKVEQNEISMNTPLSNHDGKNEGGDQTIMDRLSNSLSLDGQWDVEDSFFKNIHRDSLINEIVDFTKSYLETTAREYGFTHAFNLTQMIYHFFNRKTSRFMNEWTKGQPFELYNHYEYFKLKLRNHLRENASGGYSLGS